MSGLLAPVAFLGFLTAGTAQDAVTAGGIPQCGDAEAPVEALCYVPEPISAQAARHLIGERAFVWWILGDRLTVVGRVNSTGQALLCCAIQTPLHPIGDGGLAAISLRIPNIDSALLDVIVPTAGALGPPEVIRGAMAPPPPPVVEQLRGEIFDTEFASSSLRENRNITIYVPPNLQAGSRLPVIYLADGESTRQFASILEAAIVEGRARPTMIVGIHSASGVAPDCTEGHCDRRNLEYVSDSGRSAAAGAGVFERHLSFVIDELIPSIERNYPASARREDRIAAGYSSGAVWAFAAAAHRSDVFGGVLAMSSGARRTVHLASGIRDGRIYAGAGIFEPSFLQATRERANLARLAGADVRFREINSGHSQVMWELLFADGVAWLLAPHD